MAARVWKTRRQRHNPNLQVQLMTTPDQNPISDLASAARAIFANDVNEFALDSGKVVTVSPGKMKHVPAIMGFFSAIMNRMDQEQLSALIDVVVAKQQEAVRAGKNPLAVDVKELAADVLTGADSAEDVTRKLVGTTLSTASLILGLTTAVLEELPAVVPHFTNLTEDEFGELSMDEAALVAGGIFIVNYRFFTQNLRPVMTAFLGGVMRKQMSAKPSDNAKPAIKRITRR